MFGKTGSIINQRKAGRKEVGEGRHEGKGEEEGDTDGINITEQWTTKLGTRSKRMIMLRWM